MPRRCSHCGDCGHNYRGCPTMDPEEKNRKIQENKDKKEEDTLLRRAALKMIQRNEAERRLEQRVSYSVENKNEYEVALYWARNDSHFVNNLNLHEDS